MKHEQMAGLALVLLSCLAVQGKGQEWQVIDEIAVVVNQHTITQSELRQEAAVWKVELWGAGAMARQVTPEFMATVVDDTIDQRLLLDEASRQTLAPVTKEEQERLVEEFRRRFSSQENFLSFLQQHQLGALDLGELLARRHQAELMRDHKLKSVAGVDDEAVAQFYREHRRDFGAAGLDMVGEAIRLKLMTQKREKVLRRWTLDLRKRAQVRMIADATAEQKPTR